MLDASLMPVQNSFLFESSIIYAHNCRFTNSLRRTGSETRLVICV